MGVQSYVKKITTELCWKRDVDREVPIMRCQGECLEGWEEISSYGTYIRWRGRFAAQVAKRPENAEEAEQAPLGVLVSVGSYVLILPSVGADWLRSFFQTERVELDRTRPGETRTGNHFFPEMSRTGERLDCIRFVLDLGLAPAKPKAAAQSSASGGDEPSRGYEFVMRIGKSDDRYDPMDGLLQQSEGLTPLFAPRLTSAA